MSADPAGTTRPGPDLMPTSAGAGGIPASPAILTGIARARKRPGLVLGQAIRFTSHSVTTTAPLTMRATPSAGGKDLAIMGRLLKVVSFDQRWGAVTCWG